jgi:hypothetical protein
VQLTDQRLLALRQDVGADFVDPEAQGHGARRALIVACGHDDPQAAVVQRLDGCRRRRLDAIGNGHETGELLGR